jgi:uncharacterized glyoxalase superfamily protein PhnB
MRDYRDAKTMAQALRDGLRADGVELTHSRCLELVARQFGYDNWNILAAKIASASGPGPGPVEIAFQTVVPVVRIFDVAKAKEFYLDYLGFQWDWEHRFDDRAPLYAQVSRADVVFHLSEHHGDGSPGSAFLVNMSGVDAYHRELGGKGYGRMRPGLEQSEWEGTTIQVIDPFGNRIRFRERKAAGAD